MNPGRKLDSKTPGKREEKHEDKTKQSRNLVYYWEDEENRGKHRKHASGCDAMQNIMTRAKDEGKMVTAGQRKGKDSCYVRGGC